MATQYDIPDEYRNKVKGALAGGRIELPFDAPVFWWSNGDARASQDGSGVQHFGGWACMHEELETKSRIIPDKFPLEAFTTKDGQTHFDVYTTRLLTVALIGRRFRWSQTDWGGSRSHAQYLAYAGLFTKGKGYEPWSPIVLSGKGLVTLRLETAFKEFERATSKARKEFANDLPAWFFYCPIGTHGERVTEMVGKKGQQSAITPPRAILPDRDITAKQLESWYVGKPVVETMMDCLDQAADWLAAWDKEEGESRPEAAAPEPFEGSYPDSEVDAGDIPF